MPFPGVAFTALKPKPKGYPERIETLGDQIRARRMDLGFYITELAKQFGVEEDTVINWELRDRTPSIHHWPELVDFLGYYPGPIATFADRLLGMRRCHGLTIEALAGVLGVDPTTLNRAKEGRNRSVDVEAMVARYF